MVVDGCCGAIVGILVAAALAGPTITSVMFFFLLGLLIGTLARIKVDARARAAFVRWQMQAAMQSALASEASLAEEYEYVRS
ncbi:MAG: hypothetical protein JO110_24470 [Acetobacteraceae bacterium]|nr:hypothetical protein [Acetobacteraceae bacterium]